MMTVTEAPIDVRVGTGGQRSAGQRNGDGQSDGPIGLSLGSRIVA